jgi:hypothetical protein
MGHEAGVSIAGFGNAVERGAIFVFRPRTRVYADLPLIVASRETGSRTYDELP